MPGNTRGWVLPVQGKSFDLHPSWAVPGPVAVGEKPHARAESHYQLSLLLVAVQSKPLSAFHSFLKGRVGHGPQPFSLT